MFWWITAPANSCDKKCFLKYEFNGNLEDSSCTNAAAQVVKGGIGYVKSRFGSAAVFNGSGYIDVSPKLFNICFLM